MKNYQVRESLSKSAEEELKSYPELLRSLLFHRGVTESVAAEKFLNPDYDAGIHDPFLMKDMKKAVGRITEAMENGEKIVIYSDYDADGIPGGVVLHDFFKEIGYTNFSNYIPHRHNEGFGLHHDAIESFVPLGVKLLITIDCGIADAAEVERAQASGIDVIVTDHHLPPEKIPPAFAILNPKQENDAYPEKMLCGSGVIFKLIQALILMGGLDFKPGREKWLLDMVGLATLSDMVPLTGENRIFAHYGLSVLRKSPRPGLTHLLSKLKIAKQYLTEDDLGFMVVPRINAASRMGVPQDAFNMLASRDSTEAPALAERLEAVNMERKTAVAGIVKDLHKHMKDREVKSVIVMGNPEWRPSLLGLAANSLAEEYNRPVFLWGRDGDNEIKGSCRSGGGINVVKLMEGAREHIVEFGGHEYSGGFSVAHDKIHYLETALVDALEASSQETADALPTYIDRKLTLEEVTPDSWRHIEKLGPFGTGNPKPLFLFENISPSKIKMFGKATEHLELSFPARGGFVKAVGFFTSPNDFTYPLKENVPLNLVASLEKSYFMNRPELRLRIVDVI